jgi:hypothetical protein
VQDECMYRELGYVHMYVGNGGSKDYIGCPALLSLALL